MADSATSPSELTAPAMQRLARKGVDQRLSEAECAELCACVVFHVDEILRRSRRPRIASTVGAQQEPAPAGASSR